MDFIAIDIETANHNLDSICQLGIVEYNGGKIVKTWDQLINPLQEFDDTNIGIHGICDEDVEDEPSFWAFSIKLSEILNNKIVVSHTSFDKNVLIKSYQAIGSPPPDIKWLDSSLVVRRVWEQFAKKGYGLKAISTFLGYSFQHHDALEDAKAAGNIICHAAAHEKTNLEGLRELTKKTQNRWQRYVKIETQQVNKAGSMLGEVLVFTGDLSISRQKAADHATHLGCEVKPSVTKKTTFLIVGTQDLSLLAGHKKSSKHRKAEQLISKGQKIRILTETDFISLQQ